MTAFNLRFGVVAALLAAAPAAPLLAQTADKAVSGALEEIVVTATRRSERLQDVPISVSAFSQDKLDSQGLRNVDDLTRLTPGVAFTRNGTGSSANYNDENSDINVRGIQSSAGTSTTGVYVDDTPIQSRHIGFGAVNAFPVMFDLDRVEVLRGPQGTLFGAGAEGGVVRFLSPQPGLHESSGYTRAELATTKGGDPSYEFGAAAGGPIIDDVLGFRVSASFRRDGGWVDRVAYTRASDSDPLSPPIYANDVERRANWQQTMSLRAALTWKVNDQVKITPSIYYQRLQINDTAAYWTSLSDPASGVYRNGNRLANESTDPFYLGSVKAEWDLGFGTLVSNTSYLSRDQHSTSDYSQYLRATYQLFALLPSTYPPPGAGGFAPFGDTQRNFYQEVRLSSNDATARLTWTGGLFYSRLNENVPEDIIDPTLNAESGGNICSDALPCPNGLIFNGPTNRVVDKQLAAFGEVNFKLTDTLKATVGLRVSKVDFTGSYIGTGPFLGETIVTSTSGSEKPVTPKVVLSWQPDRDNLAYLNASKGFRPGGVNVGVGGICEADLSTLGLPLRTDGSGKHQVPGQFASDSLWSYELGAKNSFLDHRLQVNSSVFYIDWKNIQQNVYLPSCGEQFTANLGKVESVGGDLNVLYRPVESVLLDFTVAYTDAKYTNSSCAGSLTFNGTKCSGTVDGNPVSTSPITSKGDRLPGAPWTVMAAVEYSFGEWSGRKPYARLDYQHGAQQKGLISNSNDQNALFDTTVPQLPVTNNLNLRAGLRFNGFDLSLFAQNLTNAHPILFRSRDIAWSGDNLYFERGVRPRTFGVTATYKY
jgi:iron complex outermembrane recepter protein